MSSDQRFEFESLEDPHSIRTYLEAIIDGLQKGRILLCTDGNEIELCPNKLLRFAVKAKKKSDSNELSLKIAWKDTKPASNRVAPTISISS